MKWSRFNEYHSRPYKTSSVGGSHNQGEIVSTVGSWYATSTAVHTILS